MVTPNYYNSVNLGDVEGDPQYEKATTDYERRTGRDIEEGWDDQIITGNQKDFNTSQIVLAAGMTLIAVGAAVMRINTMADEDIAIAAENRVGRNVDVLLNSASSSSSPMFQAPPVFMRSGIIEGALGVLSDWLWDRFALSAREVLGSGKVLLGDRLKDVQSALNHYDRVGQFGYHEAYVNGGLNSLTGEDMGIPWTTCEDNNNCSSDSPVCDVCQGLAGTLFAVEDWMEPAHDLCRCNEPLADPVPMSTGAGPAPGLTDDQLARGEQGVPVDTGQTNFDTTWKEET